MGRRRDRSWVCKSCKLERDRLVEPACFRCGACSSCARTHQCRPRRFPILQGLREEELDVPRSIPWEAIAPHEDQALQNHCGQSLEDLARRGGPDPSEVFLVVTGRPLFRHGIEEAELLEKSRDLVVKLAAT